MRNFYCGIALQLHRITIHYNYRVNNGTCYSLYCYKFGRLHYKNRRRHRLTVYCGTGRRDDSYADFYASVNAVVMGSKTYEPAKSFGKWPYPEKKSFVFSRQKFESNQRDVEFVSGDVKHTLKTIETLGI